MGFARTALVNPVDTRPRAGWRILLVFAIAAVLILAIGKPLAPFLGPRGAGAAAASVASLVAVWFGAKRLDRRHLEGVGLSLDANALFDFFFGLVLGTGLLSGVWTIERALGWIGGASSTAAARPFGPVGGGFGPALTVSILFFVAVGWYEELMFRGYILRNFSEGLTRAGSASLWGITAATVGTSAIFGVGHALNQHATVLSIVNIALAGVMMSLAYVFTSRIALPVGLHISWNFAEGVLFGYPISGVTEKFRLFQSGQAGPALWTGGNFGPEGGLLGLAALAAGSAAVLLWSRLRYGRLSLAIWRSGSGRLERSPETRDSPRR